jgi:hypothetical protein
MPRPPHEKTTPSPQVPDNQACDIYADVDFGHGPVEIRCTVRGAHTVHICNVVMRITAKREDFNIFSEGDHGQEP